MLLIPSQDGIDLEVVTLAPETTSTRRDDEDLQRQIFPLLTRDDNIHDEATTHADETKHLQIQRTLLLRPTQDRPGLVAWHYYSLPSNHSTNRPPNRRATGLAMTCGLFSCRFYGHVLVEFQTAPGYAMPTTTVSSQDAKPVLLEALQRVAAAGAVQSPDDRLWKTLDDKEDVTGRLVRSWLLQATKENYHDQETVQRWTQITSRPPAALSSSSSSASSTGSSGDDDDEPKEALQNDTAEHEFVTHEPLCLQCRRPTSNLCKGCQGAYFCEAPRACRQQG